MPQFQPDPDRWYILTFAHSGKTLGADNPSREDGVAARQWPYRGKPLQQWSFVEVEPGWYLMKPRHEIDRVLDVPGSRESNGVALHTWTRHGGPNQQWSVTPAGDRGYSIRSRASTKAIDVRAASTLDGADIIQWAVSGGDNQIVQIEPLPAAPPFAPEPGAWYTLSFAHSGQALVVEGRSSADGAGLVQWPNLEVPSQLWTFEEVETTEERVRDAIGNFVGTKKRRTTWYVIRARHCGKVLSVENASTSDGARIVLWQDVRGSNQQWRIDPHADGYVLRSRSSGANIDLRDASLEPGAPVVQRKGFAQSTCVRVERVTGPLPDVSPTALRFSGDDAALLLPLIEAVGNYATTVEAWVRPAGGAGTQTLVELGENGSRFALERDGAVFRVRLSRGDRTHVLSNITWAFEGGGWIHVAVTVWREGGRSHVEVYVNGIASDTRTTDKQGADDAKALFRARALSQCAIGGARGGGSGYVGEVAEVRIWRARRSASAIAASWTRRARGDEPELAACYRLDALVGDFALDQSPACLHINARNRGLEVSDAGPLPLGPTRAGAANIEASGTLQREWIPLASLDRGMLDALALDVGWYESDPERPVAASDLGPVVDDRVELSVFEAVIRPRDPDGTALVGARISVRLAADSVVSIDEADGRTRLERWSADTRLLQTASDGALRLRFVAQTVACPTIWTRHAGMPDDVWTAVHPDVGSYAAMHALTGDELLAPADGRPSPLPAGASGQDAAAVAQVADVLAWVGAPRSVKPSTRGLLGSAVDLLERIGEAIEDASAVAWKPVKAAGELVVLDAAALDALAEQAVGQIPRLGKPAIVHSIAAADRLAVVMDDASDIVQVVGQTGERYWRVVVIHIGDAAAVLGAFFRRVGVSVAKFLEYLAMLVDWRRFLATSDRIYDSILESFADMKGALPTDRALRAQLASYLEPGPDSPHFDLSMNELIAAVGEPPRLDELELVLGYANRIFGASKPPLPVPRTQLALDLSGVDAGAVRQTFERLMPDMLSSPDQLMTAPMRPVWECPAALWTELADVVERVYGALLDSAEAIIDALEGTLTTRLQVPWLTRLIEQTILGADGKQRTLDLLRLASLLAAIPAVLGRNGDGGGASPTTRSSGEVTPATETGAEDREEDREAERLYRDLVRAGAGLSITNWTILTLRAAASVHKPTNADYGDCLKILQSVVLGGLGGVEMYRAGAAEASGREHEAPHAFAGFVLNLIDAGLLFFLATYSGDNKDLKDTAELCETFGIGAGWMANAASYACWSESLGWETAYWASAWGLDGFTRWAREAAKGASTERRRKLELSLTACGVSAIGIHALYAWRSTGTLPS